MRYMTNTTRLSLRFTGMRYGPPEASRSPLGRLRGKQNEMIIQIVTPSHTHTVRPRPENEVPVRNRDNDVRPQAVGG